MCTVFGMSIRILGYPRMLEDTLDLGLETSSCAHCIWDVHKDPRMLEDTLDLGLEASSIHKDSRMLRDTLAV